MDVTWLSRISLCLENNENNSLVTFQFHWLRSQEPKDHDNLP